jgi:hypothetical protein
MNGMRRRGRSPSAEDKRMANLPPPQLNDEDLELLSAYIDGQLAAGERAALEERLGAEPPLRLALEELRATVAALRTLEPVRPPRSFTLDPAQVTPRGAGRFNLLRLLPLAGTMAAVLICAVVTIGVWSQGGLGAPAGGGSSASAPLSASEASAPTPAPETSAMQAPAAASEAMEAAPVEPPANADTAARAAPTASPAGTLAPAATAAPAATTAAAAGQENTPSEPPAPMAAAEPTAKIESYSEGTPAPGVAAGEAPLAAQEDASVATPAGSSPDTVQLATPEGAAPPATVTRPAVSPAVLIILPLLFLALGAWLYVVARRRR